MAGGDRLEYCSSQQQKNLENNAPLPLGKIFVPGQVGGGVKLGGGQTVGLVLSLVLVLGLGLDLDLEEVRQSVHVDSSGSC